MQPEVEQKRRVAALQDAALDAVRDTYQGYCVLGKVVKYNRNTVRYRYHKLGNTMHHSCKTAKMHPNTNRLVLTTRVFALLFLSQFDCGLRQKPVNVDETVAVIPIADIVIEASFMLLPMVAMD